MVQTEAIPQVESEDFTRVLQVLLGIQGAYCKGKQHGQGERSVRAGAWWFWHALKVGQNPSSKVTIYRFAKSTTVASSGLTPLRNDATKRPSSSTKNLWKFQATL